MPVEDTVTDIVTPRLRLRPLSPETVRAIVEGHRLSGWADDYPDTGDLEIARMLHGSAGLRPELAAWGHRQVIESASGTVIGGVGYFGPPTNGAVEIGYGIVPSRQGHGYATEAVRAMLRFAWASPAVKEVLAGTAEDNRASQRVLDKTGFGYLGRDGDELRYHIIRPPEPSDAEALKA